MKNIFKTLLTVLVIIFTAISYGQGTSGNVSFSYYPTEEGFKVTGTFRYEYTTWQGQPMHSFNLNYNVDRSKIMVNGKWYSASDVGSSINEVSFMVLILMCIKAIILFVLIMLQIFY